MTLSLRWACAGALVVALGACGGGAPEPGDDGPAPTASSSVVSLPEPDGYAEKLFALTNAAREGQGLAPLTKSACAEEWARKRAQALVGRQLEHAPMQPVIEACGTAAAGENLVDSDAAPDDVMAAWMDSPGHRNNIVDDTWSELGVACVPHDGELLCAQIFLQPQGG